MTDPLISVTDLTKHYPLTEGLLGREVGRVRAVDGVDLSIRPGETLGLVGESGCGKSTVASTVLRLEEPTGGEIRFDGEPVTEYDAAELTRFRRRAQLVLQDPNTTFDPRMTVAETVGEPLLIHGMAESDRRRAIVEDILDRVGLSGIDLDRYPHEFSGGQKQRIALARSLVLDPDLLVADEPVSGLDVSVQASVLELMADLQESFDLSILFISHDMSVIREVSDRIAVMYLGEIVERGPIADVFEDPAHPYTRALMEAIPTLDREGPPPEPLSGTVPDPANPAPGCRFHTRCPVVIQPDDLGLPEETWRAIFDFRMALEAGEFERETLDGDGTGAEPESFDAAVRGAFDIPEQVPDANAERALSEAIARLESAEREGALARLRDAFESPCERGSPDGDGTVRERPRGEEGPGSYRCKRPH